MPAVIIPAYKPDETLVSIAEQLWAYGSRIIVVDDGSGDMYSQVFDKIRDISIILRHCENRGKGAAVKTALSYIDNEMWDVDCIGIMDADGQHTTGDMMRLLTHARQNRGSLVIGVRKIGRNMPLRSMLGNLITRTVFHMVTGVKISDTQTGLRAFGRESLKKMLAVDGERYEYEMNVLIRFAREGIPIKEVPVSTIYNDDNNSCSHFRAFRDSFRIYKDILKFALSSFSSFLLDFSLFSALMAFMPHTAMQLLTANIAARAISGSYNYSMNCRFVFHTGRKISTAFDYFTLALFILLMNNMLLEISVQLLGFSVYPAKLMTEGILFAVSWLVQKLMIFRSEGILRAVTKGARA